MLNGTSLYSGYVHERPKTNWSSKEFIKENLIRTNFGSASLRGGGIPVISDGKTGYIDSSDNHVAIFGTSGFKKSLAVYMPLICILASAGENFFVTDPKGELYERTANYVKSLGYRIRVINLRDHNGECYNPLYYPAKLYAEGDTDRASIMLSNIIDILSRRHTERESLDPFWPETAKTYISGVIHLMINSFPKIDAVNLLNLADSFIDSSAGTLKILFDDYPLNKSAVTNIKMVLSEPDKTRQCTLATASSFIQPFIQNDKVCREICSNTFELDELTREKTAFYVITDDTSTAFNPIVSVMISQLQNILIDSAFHSKGGKLGTRVNFILDEFCSFPLPNICEALATHRSRNIRYFLCIQSIDLLEKVYGNYQSILTNCATSLFLGSSEMKLLEEISARCGTTTMNSNEIAMPLISVSELMTLKKTWETKEMLYLNTSLPARYCTVVPAIEGYGCFSGYGKAQLPDIKHPEVCSYRVCDLLDEFEEGEIDIPFANDTPRFAGRKEKTTREYADFRPRRSKKYKSIL